MECRVCEKSVASRHNHYGADLVCSSCRGFFLRSVQSGLYDFFACSTNKGKKCVIDSKQRQSCRKCRFEKCIAKGMKVSYVLDKQDRCKRIMSQAQRSPKAISRPCSFSETDFDQLQDQHRIFMENYFQLAIKYYACGNLGMLWNHCTFCQFGGRSLSYDEVAHTTTMDDYALKGSLMKMVKRNNIKADSDAAILVANSVPKIYTILMAGCAFVSPFNSDF